MHVRIHMAIEVCYVYKCSVLCTYMHVHIIRTLYKCGYVNLGGSLNSSLNNSHMNVRSVIYVLHFQWPHSQFSMPHTSQEWSNPIVNITLESIRLIMCVYTCVYILASITMVAIT